MNWFDKLVLLNSHETDTKETKGECGDNCSNKCPAAAPHCQGEQHWAAVCASQHWAAVCVGRTAPRVPAPPSQGNKYMLRLVLLPFPTSVSSARHKDSSLLVVVSHSVVYDYLRPHGLQHARIFCPSKSPGACSNSCPLSQICHPTISSCPPLLILHSIVPASGSILMSTLHIR